jgi:hypothetical protein
MTIPFTDEQMKEMGYTSWRELPDGTILAVGPMLFGNGRLFVDINGYGYEDCYCYDSLELAEKSMLEFNPDTDKEPKYWKRHPFTGRRREGGDPAKECVRM